MPHKLTAECGIESPKLSKAKPTGTERIKRLIFSDLGRAAAVLVGLLLLAVIVTAHPDSGKGVNQPVFEGDRGNLFGSYLAARHAAHENDTRAAAEYYREAVKEDPDNNVILERAFLLEISSGNLTGAVDLADRLTEIDERHRLSRYALGVIALRARQFTEARRHFALSDKRGPIGEMVSSLLIAWSHQGSGDTEKALQIVDELDGPDWFGIFKSYHSALIADLAGRSVQARSHYAAAYAADSSLLRVAEGYARFLARTGETEKAVDLLETYEKVIPDHPIMSALLAEVKRGGAPDPMIRSTPEGAAEGLYGIGSALGRERGNDLAIVFLEFARHLHPTSPQILVALGNIHEQNENYDLAIEMYDGIPTASPYSSGARIQAALNLNELEREQEAIDKLLDLITDQPDNLEALRSLGFVYRVHERYEEAVDIFTRAIKQVGEIGPDNWRLLYSRGISYERLKQWDKAEPDLVQALELNPDSPQILNYLGYSWIDQGLYLDKAMDMIRRAVEQRPDDGFIVDSLGWAHYRLGNYDEAVTALERAVHLKPNDPVINDHLGDAYWKVGRKIEARFQWEQAKAFDPTPEVLEVIERKLESGLIETSVDRTAGESETANGG